MEFDLSISQIYEQDMIQLENDTDGLRLPEYVQDQENQAALNIDALYF